MPDTTSGAVGYESHNASLGGSFATTTPSENHQARHHSDEEESVTQDPEIKEIPDPMILPWFRLPTELRNEIYRLTASYQPLRRGSRPRFIPLYNTGTRVLRITPAPNASLRAVSKMVQDEYMSELEPRMNIIPFRPMYERSKCDFPLDTALAEFSRFRTPSAALIGMDDV